MKKIIKNNINEFTIKDKDKIIIGRILILEKDKKNKSTILRLNLYKDISREFEEEILENICHNFLVKENFFKLNIITANIDNILSYSSLGFSLEGILLNNIYENTHSEDEYIFGIDLISFTNKKEISFVKLETDRLTLKLGTPSYADKYLDYYLKNRYFLEAFEPLRNESFYTKKGQEESLKSMYRSYLNGDSINLGVFLKDTLIGKVQISNILYGSFKSAILGYGLHKDYEGNGFMSEALKSVIEYCFNDLGLHRIEASTLTDNIKSQNTLNKVEFEKIGLNKDYLYINGSWRDHFTYALINSESD